MRRTPISKIDLRNKIARLIKENPVIHLTKFLEDNNFYNPQVTKKLILEIADEHNISVKVYNNGTVHRDWNKFKILTDAQFGRENNITRERARQLRKIHAPETNTNEISKNQYENIVAIKDKETDNLILQYIRIDPMNINIAKFLKTNKLWFKTWGGFINKERFRRVAKENGIGIVFRNGEYEHGRECTRNSDSCQCEIGKLANTISYRYRYNGKILSSSFVDYLANTYIDFYKKDKSKKHKNFYDDVDQEVEFFLEEQITNKESLLSNLTN